MGGDDTFTWNRLLSLNQVQLAAVFVALRRLLFEKILPALIMSDLESKIIGCFSLSDVAGKNSLSLVDLVLDP